MMLLNPIKRKTLMSQINSGTLAIEWIAPSISDGEYPGSIPPALPPEPNEPGGPPPPPGDPISPDLPPTDGFPPPPPGWSSGEPLTGFPPGGLLIPVEDELCTPTIPDNCCLTEPLPVFWVCSQYSGGYDYGGWRDYGGGLVSAWNPPPPVRASTFCSCSPRFITADDSVVSVPFALFP